MRYEEMHLGKYFGSIENNRWHSIKYCMFAEMYCLSVLAKRLVFTVSVNVLFKDIW